MPTVQKAQAEVDNLLESISDNAIVYGMTAQELSDYEDAHGKKAPPASSTTQRERMAAALKIVLASERLARTCFADWQANRKVAGASNVAISRPYAMRAELVGELFAQAVRLQEAGTKNVDRNRIRTVANGLGILMKLHAAEWPDPLDSPIDPVTFFRGV